MEDPTERSQSRKTPVSKWREIQMELARPRASESSATGAGSARHRK